MLGRPYVSGKTHDVREESTARRTQVEGAEQDLKVGRRNLPPQHGATGRVPVAPSQTDKSKCGSQHQNTLEQPANHSPGGWVFPLTSGDGRQLLGQSCHQEKPHTTKRQTTSKTLRLARTEQNRTDENRANQPKPKHISSAKYTYKRTRSEKVRADRQAGRHPQWGLGEMRTDQR